MPTVYREGPFRFFFNSREEERRHIHVEGPDGTAKFWLDPAVGLATSYNMSARTIGKLRKIVEAHRHEFDEAWDAHFSQ